VTPKIFLAMLTICFFASSAVAAETAPAAVTTAKTQLEWVGCGISKKAYVTDLAEAFEKKTNIHINIKGGGATKGIRQVVSREADLGGSCRYNLPEDPREAGVGLEPVAWDSLVVITHKDNPVKNLSMQQVKDIYTGKLTNWKAVGGPDAKIELFTRASKYSGVGRTLRKLIFADFDQEIASTKAFKSTGPLEKAITETPFSMGMTGISSARLRDAKILRLEGVEPTYDNVKSGQYQLYRPLYITYNPDSDKLAEVKEFMRFCHSREGRAIMRKNGTLPYREGVHLVMRQIDQDLSAFRNGAEFSLKTNQ